MFACRQALLSVDRDVVIWDVGTDDERGMSLESDGGKLFWRDEKKFFVVSTQGGTLELPGGKSLKYSLQVFKHPGSAHTTKPYVCEYYVNSQ